MNPAVLAATVGYGLYLLYTALIFGWRGVRTRPAHRRDLRAVLDRAGLGGAEPRQVAVAALALFGIGSLAGGAVFGGLVPALAVGALAMLAPASASRARIERRRTLSRDAWPALIEEIRVRTASAGRSLPQALFETAAHAPDAMQRAFADAQREWALTTDFERTLAVLKVGLADATADVVCETLLVAHDVGGTDIDRRLAALVEDRVADVHGRQDAAAKQAGVRFARRFVLIVPLGMAVAGLTIGDGRAAYATSTGQIAVLVAVALLAVCWLWSGRIMRLPREDRVFRT